ncbi:DUF6443 domain-containing protein [Mucilaginibacter kameinonensis]|uniref:DUF6443 domain-containing protein n=1 Tax=Mucilaginibacter kameinonensis TaxID=452286 RepID=UPI000EF75F3A|nr:DUF6443 domain-containing protein [Mucilaginibacter kameinonensis]
MFVKQKNKGTLSNLHVNVVLFRIGITLFLSSLISFNAFGQLTLNAPNTVGSYSDPVSITLGVNFSANGANGAFSATINPSYNTGNSQVSFVSNWVPRSPLASASALKAKETDNNSVNISTKFFDGLGRVIQTVEKNYTSGSKDLITPFEYDNLGRQVKKYLPYAYLNTYAGNYRPAAISEQQAFYNSGSTINAQSNSPSSKVLIEASPLERILEEGGMGESWQLTGTTGGGHTRKHDYTVNNTIAISDVANTRIVVAYGVTVDNDGNRSLTVFGTNGYYSDGDLFVEIDKDENWISSDGRDGTSETYTNKQGEVILKRSFIKNPQGILEIVSTYYVYDDIGNLCYVLPQNSNPDQLSPSNTVNISASLLNSICYQYQYDEKQRLVGKLTPGKNWEYLVYNLQDQVVASQDGNQKVNNQWIIKKYDGLGREIITGVWVNNYPNTTREYLQKNVLNQQTAFFETRNSTGNGYSSVSWPQDLTDIYKIDYFDDYNVPGAPAGYTYQTYAGNPNGYSNQTNGFPTISRTKLISGTGLNLWTFSYYDQKGKLIQVQATNHLSGKDIINSEYDFSGNLTKTVQQHSSATAVLTITDRFTYDHHGRELRHYEQAGTDTEILMSELTYNDVGLVIDKKLHQKSGNTRFLQSIDFRYDIRGTLLSVNDPTLLSNSSTNPDDTNVSDNDKFGLILKYDQADQPQYNGNIGSKQWGTAKPAGSSALSPIFKYDYSYDKQDRVVQSTSSTGTIKDENFSEYLSYDKMGNILSIKRWAKLNTGKSIIDDLSYLYKGNQVNRIDDASNNNIYGFKDNGSGTISKQPDEYDYDQNGNLKKDLNKGISQITYNCFNLPAQITWTDGRTLLYDYDGEGNKTRKTYTVGTNVYITDYLGIFQYEQGQLAFFNTEEGLARKNAAGGPYIYQYFLKDQVGNTQAVIQPIYPAETNADVIQITNYYPFGWGYQSDDPATLFSFVNGTADKYLFNTKELQDGIDTYDFGARNYDAATGRWNAPDPANQLLDQSPYLAMGNNPVIYRDPDGKVFGVDDLIVAAVGGVINLTTNAIQGNVHGVGSAFSYFGVGMASGVATYYGGPLAGAAVLGAGNNLVDQVVANGWGHINLGKVAVASATSVVTGWAGGQLSGVISPYINGFTSKIASPVVQQALTDGLNNIGPGFVLGTGMALINGSSIKDALGQGLSGAAMGFATGSVTGAVQGFKYARENNLDLWSGKSTRPPDLPKALSGRLGNIDTRTQIKDIAAELKARGYTITGGGGEQPEEYLPPTTPGARKGGAYVDITAEHPDYGILRINTVDTYKSGRITIRELRNAIRIRSQIPKGQHLLLIKK